MEDLIKALILIKETCIEQENCKKCPLSNGEDCLIILNSPDMWDIQYKPIIKILLQSR